MPTTVPAFSEVTVPSLAKNHQVRVVGDGRTTGHDTSLRQAALAAGLGLLLMTVLAPLANFGVLQKLVVPGDAAATANHIAAAQGLFRIAIGSFFLVAMLDVVVAWGLYLVFQPANRGLSLLAALFRVVYATMLAVALNNLVSALRLLDGADFLNAFGTAQVQAQMMVMLGAFQSGWDLALIVFGLHLLVLGILVFRSGGRLKMLGILVVIAGLGYLVDGCGKLLLPDYSLTIGMFTFVGEPLLMLWLLWTGVRGKVRGITAQ
jgi:hypothetical protein